MALYTFTSERLARALDDRARAGVRVRLLLDAAQASPDFVRRLRAGGAEVRLVTPKAGGEARFHHKFAVLDGKIVATGSYNWTVMGDIGNHEDVVIFRREATARAYQETFERIWHDKELSQP